MPPNKSTFLFVGKLSDYSAKYQVQQASLGQNWHFEVYLDGIAIWGSSDKGVLELMPEVRGTFDIIIAAFVFKRNRRLSYQLDNWVETINTISPSNTIGWMLKRVDTQPSSPKSRLNTDWKRAVSFYRQLQRVGNNNHRLALKDYYLSVMDTTDDAFLFAYRAIEDVCRAVTGAADIEKSDWNAMHKVLGTSFPPIKDLTDVATAVRHGDVQNPIVLNARYMRDQIMASARNLIAAEMRRTFPQFMK